jgi:sulfur-carrier protein
LFLLCKFKDQFKTVNGFMKTYIDLKLYATLNKFSPVSPEQHPVEPGTTVLSLIEKLGIPVNQAKLIFINGIKGELTTSLHGGERVGIFPPVGGG